MAQPSNAHLPVFVAEMEDVRPFAKLLRGIGLKHNAILDATEDLVTVTVEDARTLCAVAYIPSHIFSSWTFRRTDFPATFEFSLDSLLQCLNIFGNAGSSGRENISNLRSKRRWAGDAENVAGEGGGADEERRWAKERKGMTGMRMEWMGPGYELNLLLRDESKGPTTTCALRTLDPEEILNPIFDQNERALYVIMRSDWFRDALLDLPPSSSRITLSAIPPRARGRGRGHGSGSGNDSPEPERDADVTANSTIRTGRRIGEMGQFSIQAEGDFGSVELDYPNDKEVMQRFICVDEGVSFSYHSAHFAHLSRALQNSIKVCLEIQSDGFLSAQIMMAEGEELGEHGGLLHYKMQALEDEVL
ncbi:cell cycle checkpoint protein [Cryptococcus bacillisporus CA1873]|uniref:Cell cycle checkpoint protein n=1 Tax=Cryptococcus bacillisporus CA1873 TaxID=1296111 RepID=A0ABR5B859_CRYGA|nr:cell cycle checkpoint protein [Cryptococcus bacillisporus CA1873]|eukprot:KIR59745.1 cell cycle checkpoint protein [Cryptococcus gattii CA1873]